TNLTSLKTTDTLIHAARNVSQSYWRIFCRARFQKVLADSLGLIIQPPDRAAHIAEPYAQSTERNGSVVCATQWGNRPRDGRHTRRSQTEGYLGDGIPVPRDVSLNWTTARKTDWRNFHPGSFLGFHRPVCPQRFRKCHRHGLGAEEMRRALKCCVNRSR